MDPVIRVTRIKNRWHARMFYNGELRDEMACEYRQDVGMICKIMLRWYDKLGGTSKYADKARHRNKEGHRHKIGPLGKVWYLGKTNLKVKAMGD